MQHDLQDAEEKAGLGEQKQDWFGAPQQQPKPVVQKEIENDPYPLSYVQCLKGKKAEAPA